MSALKPALVAAAALLCSGAQSAALGPSSYLGFDDSPFKNLAFSTFHLETFEDHLFDTPGASANAGGVTSVVFGAALHDSVDADDGSIDGSGLQGDSYFSGSGSAGILFSFSAAALGALPTHAGLVWTDGGAGTSVTFRAFGPGMQLLFEATYPNFGDGSNGGTTDEDRFLGFESAAGIEALFVSHTSGGIEVDHLQYGIAGAAPNGVPEPAALALCLAGLGAAGASCRRRATRTRPAGAWG